jgi:hypothetical protein
MPDSSAQRGPRKPASKDQALILYEQLIHNLYDGVYFVDRERMITYWTEEQSN